MSKYKNRKLYLDAELNADQTEFIALKLGSAPIDSGLHDDSIANTFDDFELDSSNDEEWALRDVEKDSAAGLMLEAFNRRKELLKEHYPFEINGSQIKPLENGSPIYNFCLAITNAPNITTGRFTELPRKFELLAAHITSLMFVGEPHSIHTGWPRSAGKPKAFSGLAEEIKAATASKNEWTWRPQEGLSDKDSKAIKDCGIDYITWFDFHDQRDGKLYVAGQCACGNDWTNKFQDINFRKLNNWFHPSSFVPPIKAIAIPFCSTDEYLIDSSNAENLMLDRIRLTLMYENGNSSFEGITSLKELTKMVLDY